MAAHLVLVQLVEVRILGGEFYCLKNQTVTFVKYLNILMFKKIVVLQLKKLYETSINCISKKK